MAEPLSWGVAFYDGTAWRDLPSVNGISTFCGRRQQIDDYSVDTATVTSLFPSSWTYTPQLGQEIRIYNITPGGWVPNWTCFVGRIRDVKIDYGMVPNEDQVTIECEGLQADLGRTQLNSRTLNQDDTISQYATVAGWAGMPAGGSGGGRSIASGQTYTGNAMALINDIVRTEEGRFWTGVNTTYLSAAAVTMFARNKYQSVNYPFNDGTTPDETYQFLYDGVEFRSTADNYYNQVTITPLSVAAQTATLNQTPIYAWQRDTLDYTTGQAADHAQYLLNNFQDRGNRIASITFTDIQQIDPIGPSTYNVYIPQIMGQSIAAKVSVGFRGTVHRCIIEGVAVTAVPGVTRCTLYLSPEDTNAYLILDDAVYGRLDYNKLGY